MIKVTTDGSYSYEKFTRSPLTFAQEIADGVHEYGHLSGDETVFRFGVGNGGGGSYTYLRGENFTYDEDGMLTGGNILSISSSEGGMHMPSYTTTISGFDATFAQANTDAFWAKLLDAGLDITVRESSDRYYAEGGQSVQAGPRGDIVSYVGELRYAKLAFDGGAGRDVANFAKGTTALKVDLADPYAFSDRFGLKLTNFETIRGTEFDDTIIGDDAANRIEGLGGADELISRGGDDTLLGGDGTDTLSGGDGRDLLAGGAGSDRLFGAAGMDRLHGGSHSDHLFGEAGADILRGGLGDDGLFGGGYHDQLFAWTGNDYLVGAEGDDTLFGQAGSDELFGGLGKDLLVGGSGNDLLVGGAGRDLYHLTDGFGRDTVRGFVSGEDRIDLSALSRKPADLEDALMDTDAGVVLTLGRSTLLLEGVELRHIDTQSDFILA